MTSEGGRWGHLASVLPWMTGLLSRSVDGGPNWWRYGPGKSLRTRLFRRPLVQVGALPDADPLTEELDATAERPDGNPQHGTAVLACRDLDTGGVESVVSALALELPRHGWRVRVICERGGRVAGGLVSAGVDVVSASTMGEAHALLSEAASPSVVELHNAPQFMIDACIELGLPMVQVVHTMDVNRSRQSWTAEAKLVRQSAACAAVSEAVRTYFCRQADLSEDDVTVIPNGVRTTGGGRADYARARDVLARALGCSLDDSVVFVSLARYDLQKNVAGLVSAFGAALSERSNLRLVVAGPVEEWADLVHANAVRLASVAPSRIHLMGTSSARTLLAAADAFVLDSFFEGWPVAATEAAMAGIPLVLSEVGGARELVYGRGERGVLIPNPAADIERVDLQSIRIARAGVNQQRNRSKAVEAIVSCHDELSTWVDRRQHLAESARDWLRAETMAARHAVLLSEAVGLHD